jgi:hypothetical protein
VRFDSPLAESLRAAILQHAPAVWIEKVRRFVGVHALSLRSAAGSRFGAASHGHLTWMAELLLQAAAHPNAGVPCEPALLSAAWYALDASRSSSRALLRRAESLTVALQDWHRRAGVQRPCAAQGPRFDYAGDRWRHEAHRAPPVLIISPSIFSLYSVAVLKLCIRIGVPVAGVLVRRFTLARAAAEYRRDGPRLARKVWRKLILRSDENADDSVLSQRKLLAALGSREPHLGRLARRHGIPVCAVADFNMPRVGDWVTTRAAPIGLFTGGGLLREPLLARFAIGIINVHMGQLPQFKGMDVVEWPLLEGRFGNVGATAHLMDSGVDTGAVLQHLDLQPERFATLGALRNTMLGLMPLVCVDSALGLSSGRLRPEPQVAAGRQYFFVHPRLLPVVTGSLRSRFQSPTPESAQIYAAMLEDVNLTATGLGEVPRG